MMMNDVSMAIKRLKSYKSDVEGRVLSNNYIHSTDHLFMYKYGFNTQGCKS